MDKITLYYNPMSRARIAHWMLEEVGAPYEMKLISFDKNEQKSPEFLKLNPMGKIPTIVHKGVVVTESAAICAYLADAFPAANLAPKVGDPARGTYYRWLFFGNGCLEPAMMDKAFSRGPARASALAYGTYEDTVSTLEKALAAGPFLLGNQFTAADVYVASAIGYGMMTKSLEPRPAFETYLKRISDRPAYVRATTQANEMMAQMKK